MNESARTSKVRVDLAERLRARETDIARALYGHIQEAVPDKMGVSDTEYGAGMLGAVAAVVGYSLEAIEREPGWLGPVPQEAKAQAHRAARAGVSMGAVLRRYVAGHRRFGEFVAEEARRIGLSSDMPELRGTSNTLQALLERLIAAVQHEYEQECLRAVRSPERGRIELVRRLLAGELVGRAESAALGYDLDGWHVGVVAVGEAARDVVGQLEVGHRLLCVSPGEGMVWVWLGAQRRPDMARLQLGSMPPGVGLAIGEPARGSDGWRLTHQQAQRVMRVALLRPQAHIRYADVALLTPWLQDPESARSLTEIYLSPLEGQRDGGLSGIETLRAYFESGRKISEAASKLGIDRRTLAYRLRNIEECLGYRLDARIAELEVAVRLRDLLDGPTCATWKKLGP